MTAEHWCVSYADEADRNETAIALLTDGLARGEQIGYFGWDTEEGLRRGLAGLDGVDALIESGQARLTSLRDHFRPDAAPEPMELLEFWAAATETAVASGFDGFRAVAETTPWSKLAHAERAKFLRGEQLVNRYRVERPFTLVCASDASALTAEAVVDTAIIHPSVTGMSVPFRLYATGDADFALAGEMDALSVELLERALASVPHLEAGRDVVVDAVGLQFIDHGSLLALERHARGSGVGRVLLRRPPGVAARLVELLGLRRVEVEAPR